MTGTTAARGSALVGADGSKRKVLSLISNFDVVASCAAWTAFIFSSCELTIYLDMNVWYAASFSARSSSTDNEDVPDPSPVSPTTALAGGEAAAAFNCSICALRS